MKHPIWAKAFRLAGQVADLEVRLARSELREAAARKSQRQAIAERDQARRDVDLIALMANDRRAALEFIRTRHYIASRPETQEHR